MGGPDTTAVFKEPICQKKFTRDRIYPKRVASLRNEDEEEDM